MKWNPASAISSSFFLAACAVALTACSGGGGGGSSSGGGSGNGTLNLSATDDAFVYDIVQEASISVDRITIYHDADSEENPITLYDGTPILLDLFHLRDGVTQNVDMSVLPAGTYRQLRLHVSSARLVLINGNVYTSEDGTLHLTSQDTSGFKVFVDPPIDIESDQTADVLLDFDLTQTFHPIPANDPLNANRYSLHPVIHVTNLGHTGGIQGLVTQDDGNGGLVPVDQATVYILPPGETDPTMSVATTGTSADGTYTVLSLEPGTYDVLAVKGDLSGTVTGIVVTAGHVATADVTIHPPTGGIQGLVTQDDGSGNLVPVDQATVYILPPGVTDPTLAVATTTTDAAGTYSVPGLEPSTYDVIAVKGTLSGTVTGIAVVAGAFATADVTIH